MTRGRKRSAKRGLAAIAIAVGLLTLAPISSSFVVFSSSPVKPIAGHGGTTVITKNAPMPEWIAEIVEHRNVEVDSAQNDPSVSDSNLI
jgi:hypothetical protein